MGGIELNPITLSSKAFITILLGLYTQIYTQMKLELLYIELNKFWLYTKVKWLLSYFKPILI